MSALVVRLYAAQRRDGAGHWYTHDGGGRRDVRGGVGHLGVRDCEGNRGRNSIQVGTLVF